MLIDNEIVINGKKKTLHFNWQKGVLHRLVGENGSGKTTHLQRLVNEKWQKKIKIAFMQQAPISVLNEMNVAEFYYMLYRFHLKEHFWPTNFDVWMEKLEIVYLKNKDINSLSGGENQLLKLVAAIGLNFEYLILDEPLNALDENNRLKVLHIIKKILEEKKYVLVVDHQDYFKDHVPVIDVHLENR